MIENTEMNILDILEDEYDDLFSIGIWNIVFDSIWAAMRVVQIPYKRARRLSNFRRANLFKSKI